MLDSVLYMKIVRILVYNITVSSQYCTKFNEMKFANINSLLALLCITTYPFNYVGCQISVLMSCSVLSLDSCQMYLWWSMIVLHVVIESICRRNDVIFGQIKN